MHTSDIGPEEPTMLAAERLARSNQEEGVVFPAASMPMAWCHAMVLAQMDAAWSLRRIAEAVEEFVGRS
jgi:hypothetical protein